MTPPPADHDTRAPSLPFRLTRLGVLMDIDPDEPHEAEGVLNPGTAWGPDGHLYLFPRQVATGNVSRIGKARVLIADGVPAGVQRIGQVMAADRGWEHGTAHGGVEDPRITWIPSLDTHVMTYVAFGPLGPRPALAVSRDLGQWRRLGPVQFGYDDNLNTDLNLFPNKDVVFFPSIVPGPGGRPSYAMLHRPMWDLRFARPGEDPPLPAGITDVRASIWLSYVDADAVRSDLSALARPDAHRFLAGPQFGWEEAKIGAGPAPIRVPEGWLLIHHGVQGEITDGGFTPQQAVRYSAGMMLLSADDPSRVLTRTPTPVLEPITEHETRGTVSNVVFPTAIEVIGGGWYVFYGMADTKIGVARLHRVGGGAVGVEGTELTRRAATA